MNNICMLLLNIFPLRYTGTCLIGLCYTHHHGQRTDINPFTGEFKYFKTLNYCGVGRMLIGVVNEDSIDGNKKATWTYLQKWSPYTEDIEFDMKLNNWKPITAIKLEDPDSTNPKYWSIGYSYNIYITGYNKKDEPDPLWHKWPNDVYSVKAPDIKPAIESQVRLDQFTRFHSFSKDGFIRINNVGAGTSHYNVMLITIILNFNINLYKMDHPDLDIIYYIISNPKSINNTYYTPVKRSKVC